MSHTGIMLLFAKAAGCRKKRNAMQIIQVCFCITSKASVRVSDPHCVGRAARDAAHSSGVSLALNRND